MLTRFECINLSSPDVAQLVRFYRETLGVPLHTAEGDNDGAMLGFIPEAPMICIWDENRWGIASAKPITLVFKCDDIQATYEDLLAKGAAPNPITVAVWGGKELTLNDPDGNHILILE